MLSHFSHVWLCNSMDWSLPGSSLHGILQARILEWVAMPSSRESSRSRNWTRVSYVLEKEIATHSSTFARKIPWTEEPGRLQSMGSQRVGHDCMISLSLSLFLCFLHWQVGSLPLVPQGAVWWLVKLLPRLQMKCVCLFSTSSPVLTGSSGCWISMLTSATQLAKYLTWFSWTRWERWGGGDCKEKAACQL